ncbi:RNA-binding cell elongation regulator Jag/EloR [Sporofaciens sp. SGI.106]|uniref:RNA-binding cell elongation regulator Jag/EloR n=1 Tax=Sporofaciens sp. SGI.106 TaxID=3420568 RepID=UPI003D05052D
MEEITVSAKTLDDAITEALIQLGVTSDRLDYDVIEKGSAGFLGFGMKQAVIKARRKPEVKVEPEIKEEPKKEEEKESIDAAAVKAVDKPAKEPKKDFKKENKKETKKEPKKEFKKDQKKENRKETKKEIEKEKPEIKEVELAKVEDATIKACEEFLYSVMKTMDMEVEIVSKIDEEGALSIEMNGKNMGILIGKRGQTLDALQYLTNRVANKMQDGYVRVKLDTEDYRRRRKETLENLAKNIAHKVKKTRRPVSLEPMNPYERRIIHSALQGDKSVTTHSEGEEPYRRVVVTLVRR